MSKQYKVDMNIDVSKVSVNSGFLARPVPKEKDNDNPAAEFDPKGYKERTGPEVFAFLAAAAINGANAKCGFQALKGFRKTVKGLDRAVEKGEYVANKTDIDIIKQSINGNPNWPNADEMFDVLESIMVALESAEIIG